MAETVGARTLIDDFLAFSRRRSAAVVALVTAGAALEGAGVVMLVPIISLILGGEDAGGGFAGPAFEALGLESPAAQTIFVLAAFALLLGLRFWVLLLRDDALIRLQNDFVVDLRGRAFRRLAAMPWAELTELHQGPAAHALTRDVDRAGFGVSMIIHGGVAVVMLLVQLGLALALAPIVTMIVGLLGLALFRKLAWLRERAERQGGALTADDLALFQSVGAFLGGLKPAKAHGLERGYVAAFGRATARVAAQQRSFAWDYSLARLLLQTASGIIAILAILLGIFVLDTPPGNMVVTLLILARLYSPLQTVQNSIQGLRHAAAGYSATRSLAGAAGTAPMPESPAAEPLAAAPEIALVGAGFRTATGAILLDDISIRLPAGRVTAVSGDSGAGKSTLCDLAVGLLEPTSGSVLINGEALDAARAARLRASVAYVGQEPFLFEDSLRRNLSWGCGPVEDDEIWEALETVGAADLVRGLDGGLEARVRVDGAPFSGGERQRMRLARALLRRPRLLVLDEATNALDIEAENRVLKAVLTALRAAPGGVTVLVVSHRPETLAMADHVVALARGRVADPPSAGGNPPRRPGPDPEPEL